MLSEEEIKSIVSRQIQNKHIKNSGSNVNYGVIINELDNDTIKKHILDAVIVLSERMEEKGEKITQEVVERLSDVVEKKFTEIICNVREGQRTSEKAIIDAVHANLNNIGNNISDNCTSILNEIYILKNDQNSLIKGLDNLYKQYEWQATENYNKLFSMFESVKSTLKKIKWDYSAELQVGWDMLREGNFDSAREFFNKATAQKELTAEAYYGMALSECKVQLIWDYKNACEQPICYDYSVDITKTGSYALFESNATEEQKEKYKKITENIGEVLKYFRQFKNQGLDYDCFICIKDSSLPDEDTDDKYWNSQKKEYQTKDLEWLEKSKLYESLNNDAGIKTFFAGIDADKVANKGDIKYNALILYALSKAKCMLLICSKEEYLLTSWVKNEYTRFCNFLKQRKQDVGQIVMVFNGKPFELPNGLRGNEYQDFDRAKSTNTIQDLIERVKSRVNKVKGYVERYWKYCPICKRQSYKQEDKVCAEHMVPLIDSHMFLNEQLRTVREEAELSVKEYKNREAILVKEKEEAEQKIRDLQKQLEARANISQAELSKSKNESNKLLQEKESEIASLKLILEGVKQNEQRLKKYAEEELVKTKLDNSTVLQDELEDNIKQAKKQVEDLSAKLLQIKQNEINRKETKLKELQDLLTEKSSNPSRTKKIDVSLLDFEIKDGTLLRYIGKGGSVTIPNCVHTINAFAFAGCYALKEIVIPKSVKSIGNSAFSNCSNLEVISISGKLSIDDTVFSGCNNIKKISASLDVIKNVNKKNLREIKIIRGDNFIDGYKFQGCSNLTSLTIPNSVEYIHYNVFEVCKSLTSIYYTGDIKGWCGISGLGNLMAYGAENKALYINGQEITGELIIPDGVTSIGDSAFKGCSGLTSITIPNSVMYIGDNAFEGCGGIIKTEHGVSYVDKWVVDCDISVENVSLKSDTKGIANEAFKGCSSLTSIAIPNSVISIGGSAFYGCSGLTSITIPNSVISIGHYAFYGCSSLTSITIPNSVISIGHYAFDGCSGLTSIAIPNNVTSIDSGAFFGCSSLTSITIPHSVISIGCYAFYGYSSLTSIYYTGDIASWCGISGLGNLMSYETGNKALYINGQKIKWELIIPNDVTSIGDSAFCGCSGLTSITIPNSVTSIGEYAFCNCLSLTSISLGSGVKTIGNYVFRNCTNLKTIAINQNNLCYKSIGKCLITASGKTLIFCCDGGTIPNTVTTIKEGALYYYGRGEVTFNGPQFEWKKITKRSNWYKFGSNITIHCTDGDVKY